jgi:hypothetical protein
MSAEIMQFPAHRCRPSIAERREKRLRELAALLADARPRGGRQRLEPFDPTEMARSIVDRIDRSPAG